MSNDAKPTKSNLEVESQPLSLHELGELLVKHYRFHEGQYDVAVEFQIGVGAVGPDGDKGPGAMIGVRRIGLKRTDTPGTSVVDAAVVNPKKVSRSKVKS